MTVAPEDALDWKTFGLAFSNRLVWLRTHRGWSQEQLAHEAGMHRNQISNLERNQSHGPAHPADPLLSTVYKLARALDVAPEMLLPDRSRRSGRMSMENSAMTWPAIEIELLNGAGYPD